MTGHDGNSRQDGERGQSARTVGLRLAALTGAVLAAGAIAAGTAGNAAEPADTRVTTAVPWPMGSTCCPDVPE